MSLAYFVIPLTTLCRLSICKLLSSTGPLIPVYTSVQSCVWAWLMWAWLMARTQLKAISFLTPSRESWRMGRSKEGVVDRQKEGRFRVRPGIHQAWGQPRQRDSRLVERGWRPLHCCWKVEVTMAESIRYQIMSNGPKDVDGAFWPHKTH